MKTVGILGGMGPLATQRFYGYLIRQTDASCDQEHLHVVIDADPAIPDRTAFLLDGGTDPRPALVTAAQRLSKLGAELIVMPCNTAAAFDAEVAQGGGLPVISWIRPAVQAVRDMGVRTVGLLATTGTLQVGLYQRYLKEAGIEVVTPGRGDQERVMNTIYGPGGVKTRGAAGEDARSDLLRAATGLHEAGAQSLILACTELPIALPPDSPRWPVQAIDPAPYVAREVVRSAGGRLRVVA